MGGVGAALQEIREREAKLYGHYGLTPTERTVDLTAPSVTVRLVEFGAETADPDPPPVVVLHGIASIHAVAAPLLQHLAARRRVITVDWPGHGLSGPIRLAPDEPLRDHVVAVLNGVREVLRLDRIDLVGHSMGAQFSLYFAIGEPRVVRRLVLLGAPGAGFAGVRPVAAMRLLSVPGLGPAILRLPLSLPAYKRNSEVMVGKGLLDRYPIEMLEIGHRIGQLPGVAPSVASFFRALITPLRVRHGIAVSPAQLATIAAPILLVWGQHDVFMTPDDARESIDAIPDARLLRIPGGHLPWLDEPQICGEAVAGFLNAR